MIDYYSILGVSRDADDNEIKNTYRNLVKRYHPDVCKERGSEERFKKINEAYEALMEDQRTVSTLMKSSEDLIKAKRYAEALSMFESVLALKPSNIDALKGKGSILFQLGKYAEAVSVYNIILSKTPEDQVIWNNKGVALDNLGKYQEAIVAYERALRIDPNYAMATTNRNITLKKIQRTDNSVKSTSHEGSSERSTTGVNVVAGLSAIFAFITTLTSQIKDGVSFSIASIVTALIVFIIMYIIFLIITYVIYWIIKKAHPASENWGVLSWAAAIIGAPIAITIVLSIFAAFIFGMAGSDSNYQWVKYSNYGISFNHPSSLPLNTSAEGYSEATYYNGMLQFDNSDDEGIGVLWFLKEDSLSRDSAQKIFASLYTELLAENPDLQMSSIQTTTHSGNTVYFVTMNGHDMTENGKMSYNFMAIWEDLPSQRTFMILTASYKSQDDAQVLFDGVLNSFKGN
ncbi:MAG: DnaJ domain-containing protein [Methanoregula sp.]|jgi:hypothetical protein|uniref:tetratricopeptide repeat protein n=1 Tax=Methanoregula sp. TaxID=2052170 RepID=UPI0025F388DB|nr:DnaJ domain-containing protein [Methanoregula sp.]MCK9631955.1 DnaJ domain-containing protein [Methanoregula sp.]